MPMKRARLCRHLKHLSGTLYRLITQFHYAPSDAISAWQFEVRSGAVGVLKHVDKLGLFDFIKRLIAGDDPFNEKVLELCMIKSFLKSHQPWWCPTNSRQYHRSGLLSQKCRGYCRCSCLQGFDIFCLILTRKFLMAGGERYLISSWWSVSIFKHHV
jgi:hypothetical protein